MSNEPDNLADNLLDRATSALRNTAVHEGPKASVLANTLAAMEAAERPDQPLTLRQRIRTMRTLSKLAIAASLLISAGGMLMWSIAWAPSVAFADVMKEVRSIQSVQYRQTIRTEEPGKASQSMSGEMLVAGPSHMRFAIQGQIAVLDTKLGKFLLLDPKAKLASTGDLVSFPYPHTNLLERFQGMAANAGKPIGQKQIGDVMAEGFEMGDRGEKAQLWVNKETRLPVVVETVTPAGQLTFDEFVWNPPVDEAAMSLTPPEGYRARPAMKLDMSPSKETDIAAGLKAIAELNGGTYPDGIDMAGLRQVMRDVGARIQKNKDLRATIQADGPGAMLTIGRLWEYVNNPKNGSDWNYAGGGVQFGQADHPIFWYLPAGAANYRVINGDMSVHDVAPADLPRIPSKLIVNPAKIDGATSKPR